MPVDGLEVAVLAPQLSKKTAFWCLSSKTSNVLELLKK
jgi:hypothetical protein